MDLHLVPAVFLRRYQRFLADVRLPDGQEVRAHVPNTGSMRSLIHPGCPAWLAPAANPARALRWTLVLLGTPDGGLAVVDTGLPNRVVAEGVATGRIPELAGYPVLRREVPYGTRGSRIDLRLEAPGRPACLVEVKNLTMADDADPGLAVFPDAVTERGRKHLEELADAATAGTRAVQFYLLDRTDRSRAGLAHGIDPAYAAAARQALGRGVEFLCYQADISPTTITVGARRALALGAPD